MTPSNQQQVSDAMIACTVNGCLATFSWFGAATDSALGLIAKGAGWKVFEGSGWRCATHALVGRKDRP